MKFDLNKLLAVDTETTSINAHIARVTHVSWCNGDGEAYARRWGDVRFLITRIENPTYTKIMHNAKYDIRVLRNAGVTVKGRTIDTMIMSQMLLDLRKHGLKDLTKRVLKDDYDEKEVLDKWRRQNKDKQMWEAPDEIILPYAKKDAASTMKLFHHLCPFMDEYDMWDLFWKEMRLQRVVMKMESRGILLDEKLCKEMHEQGKKKVEKSLSVLRQMVASKDFNPNSPQQVARYVFPQPEDAKEMRRIRKKTGKVLKTAVSTETTPTGNIRVDKMCLLKANTPFAKRLLAYRRLSKAVKTYLGGFLKQQDINHVVHANLNQNGARTGRFSSSEPNLQNLPRRNPSFLGQIRKVFHARDGYVYVFIDYDQIELRLAAHFSGEQWMIEAINAGEDLHAQSCERYFGLQESHKDWKKFRQISKTMNFAMLFGCKRYTLHKIFLTEANQYVPIDTCGEYIDTYHKVNPRIADLFETIKWECWETGGVRNPFGRFISVPRGFEYAGVNYLIQSTAADVIKEQMPKCHVILKPTKSHMLLQVHDELLFEIHGSEKRLAHRLVEAMEMPDRFDVPLTCSMDYGTNWLEKRPIKRKP